MKKHEKGQGLVEYALILVLVAIVVIAVLILLGTPPPLRKHICGFYLPLRVLYPDRPYPVDVEHMDISDESVNIDVKPFFNEEVPPECWQFLEFGDIVSFPSHGTVVDWGGGSFTYRPNEVGSGIDDSFTYGWSYLEFDNIGLVTIIIGQPDSGVGAANTTSSAEQTTPELDDVQEKILAVLEEAVAQEESVEEGVDLAVEAVVEGTEVLIDYADDYNIQALSEALSQLMQEVKDGNLDAVPETITSLASDLADAPPEVSIAVLLKMAPRLIDAHSALSGGSVSPDTIAEAQQALEQLDPDYPGKAEALEFFLEGVDIAEAQNNAIEASTEVLCTIIGMIITELESAGEEGWAEQFAADSETCGN